MTWLFLGGAIVTEVVATLSLRASVEHPAWIAAVVCGYLVAYTFLGLTLRSGASIGVVYGVWGACGVALVALAGVVLFDEALSAVQAVGIAVIVLGVVVVETGSRHDGGGRGASASGGGGVDG